MNGEREKLTETEVENNYVNTCWVRVRIKVEKIRENNI